MQRQISSHARPLYGLLYARKSQHRTQGVERTAPLLCLQRTETLRHRSGRAANTGSPKMTLTGHLQPMLQRIDRTPVAAKYTLAVLAAAAGGLAAATAAHA